MGFVNWIRKILHIDAVGIKQKHTVIGDGVTRRFVIRHNFDKCDVLVQVKETAPPNQLVWTDIEITDNNTCTVSFKEPPKQGEFTVCVTE